MNGVTILRPGRRNLVIGAGIKIFGGETAAAAPESNWWEIDGATVICAYQPKGAVTLSESYSNLANPGTNDAAPGVAPTLDANGWVFNGSTQYLTTGITPASGWTMSVRFSDVSDSASFLVVCGSRNTSGERRFYLAPSVSNQVVYGAGGATLVSPGATSGVLAIAGQQGYRDGSPDGATIGAWSSPNSARPIFIGASNDGTGLGLNPIFYLACKIQALAIYSTTLGSSDVTTLYNNMAAL